MHLPSNDISGGLLPVQARRLGDKDSGWTGARTANCGTSGTTYALASFGFVLEHVQHQKNTAKSALAWSSGVASSLLSSTEFLA